MSKEMATQERVFDVADELATHGLRVTSTLIRERLGGGSFATILKHLRNWEAQRESAVDDIQTMPPQLMSVGETLVAKIWGVAHRLAQQEVGNIKKLQIETESNLTANLRESLNEIQRLEHAEKASQQTLSSLQAQLHDAELRVAEVNERARLLQQELTSAREYGDRMQQQLIEATERASHAEGELSAIKARAAGATGDTDPQKTEAKATAPRRVKGKNEDTI